MNKLIFKKAKLSDKLVYIFTIRSIISKQLYLKNQPLITFLYFK